MWTKIRGGKREGTAEKIVTTAEEAQEEVKNPPKVSPVPITFTLSRVGLLQSCGVRKGTEWLDEE